PPPYPAIAQYMTWKIIDKKWQKYPLDLWPLALGHDHMIDRFLVRRLNDRPDDIELAALAQWQASDQPFHIIRRDLYEGIPIGANNWGGTAAALPDILNVLDAHYEELAPYKDLTHILWPIIKNHTMIHDQHYTLHNARPLPEKMDGA
ncbi:MAG: hypothetical protein AAF352_01230, partial [Pseudomonadota bacterium]